MRHNQYRNKITRERGSVDMDHADKLRVEKILKDIRPLDAVFINWFLFHSRSTRLLSWQAYITDYDITDCESLCRPDLLCFFAGRDDQPYVIEIDGAVHKGDHKREKRYRDLGVPAIIVNKADLDYLDTPWEQYIKEQIANLGYKD